ncbi:MAG: hypothetical protein ACRC6M_16210 [Microcystaceae cyanobacterium]
MMEQTRWAGLSVQDFFQDYNWLGEAPKLEPTVTEAQAELAIPSLLCLKVQDFLHQANWTGIQRVAIAFPGSPAELEGEPVVWEPQSSVQLSVFEFFRQANWQGRGIQSPGTATPSKKTSSIPVPANTEIGLTDLSALF